MFLELVTPQLPTFARVCPSCKGAADTAQGYCRACAADYRKSWVASADPAEVRVRKAQRELAKACARNRVARAKLQKVMESTLLAWNRALEGKACSGCKTHKPSHQFNRNKASFDGLAAYCKVCNREVQKASKARHIEKCRAYAEEYVRRPEVKAARKAYKAAARRAKGTPTLAVSARLAGRRNARFSHHIVAWERHLAHAQKLAARALHSDAHVKAWHKHCRRSDLKTRADIRQNLYFAVKGWVRKRLRHAIPDGFNWSRMLPYSAEELACHLEAQFLPGMGWHNRTDWHIDHIRPISSFNIQHWDSDAFRACFALSNLQPLWALDNVLKGAKQP
jgi:hypothetical protein